MRTEKEINGVLKNLDEEIQKNVGDTDMPKEVFQNSWLIRCTLLWVKGELENLK